MTRFSANKQNQSERPVYIIHVAVATAHTPEKLSKIRDLYC